MSTEPKGNTVDFFLSKHRDTSAALAFFKKAINNTDLPTKVTIDKYRANNKALKELNKSLTKKKKLRL
ncbi:MAG: DDE-type integrase/transposase/recombinase [Rickettsiaceae bacterium]